MKESFHTSKCAKDFLRIEDDYCSWGPDFLTTFTCTFAPKVCDRQVWPIFCYLEETNVGNELTCCWQRFMYILVLYSPNSVINDTLNVFEFCRSVTVTSWCEPESVYSFPRRSGSGCSLVLGTQFTLGFALETILPGTCKRKQSVKVTYFKQHRNQ